MMPLIEARALSKSFGSSQVLRDVSLSIGEGEIVSLIGENGAGKSTLSKILAGIVQPDSGTISLRGTAVSFSRPHESFEAGIGMVHQELCVAENLTIAENIGLGREPRRWGMVDSGALTVMAADALRRLGSGLSPSRLVGSLSAAERQLVEIARVLSFNARLLIFDEPTSSLSESEARSLLALLKRLRSDGVSILYVSHRLQEVQEVSDRVVALRDGCISGEMPYPPFERDRLIKMIVGREIQDTYGYRPRSRGAAALEVSAFRATPRHSPCSFAVRAGEIVGIAGLIGSGRTELLESIYGARRPAGGSVTVSGCPVSIASPAEAALAGITLVPESRGEQGLIAEWSITDNTNLSLIAIQRGPALRDRLAEGIIAQRAIETLRIRCAGPDQPVRSLSGGNQQKVVLGRCLATEPRILLLDEPTRGVDVGARREIYSLLFSLAERGLAILFVSSELEEVIGIADRALVMSDGEIRGELGRESLSEHAIMALAAPLGRRAA